jgi:hypothetical protein
MPINSGSLTIDPGEFLAESGLLEKWAKEGLQCSLRTAMDNAGFRLERTEHIPQHGMTLVVGVGGIAQELRTTRRIKKEVLRSFQDRGFNVRNDMIDVDRGSAVRVHVAVLETV